MSFDVQLLSGKRLAACCRPSLSSRTEYLIQQGIQPLLAVVLVGAAPASISYVTGKKKAALSVGINVQLHQLAENSSQTELNNLLTKLAKDPSVHGILVQLPLPGALDEKQVTAVIPPEKDVDCFHPINIGRLSLGDPGFLPCTPHGIYRLLQAYGISTEGRHVVIVGRSNIVGKPLGQLMLNKEFGNATVTITHSATRNLAELTRLADILICAIGQAEFIRGSMIKEHAVVVDVGMNRLEDLTKERGYRLVGDVCFAEAKQQASWLSPVPFGVGPMTIIMLLYNTLCAAYTCGGYPFPKIDWNNILE